MKKLQLAICLLLPAALFAFDFGLVTSGYTGYTDGGFEYQARVIPRFSIPTGENGDFLLTAGMTIGKDADGEFYYAPELLRTMLTLRFGAAGLKAGRMYYADPLNFIADGLFDGVQFYYTGNAGTVNVGAWYTGLLYKKAANITMTAKELDSYYAALDYGDFSGTYFAPKRAIASIDWEHPSIGDFMRLNAAITGQFDLGNKDETYHSQYLTIKAAIPVKNWLIELGGSLEAAQADEFYLAWAGDFGVSWAVPSGFDSRLSFTGHILGGKANDQVGAFVPITTKYYGNVFKENLSGMSVLGLNYMARFIPSMGASIAAQYFIRNDLGTYTGYPVTPKGSDGYLLGTEFFARLVFSPVSDVQFNLGGGAFLPSLGNVGADQDPHWRMELNVILALY